MICPKKHEEGVECPDCRNLAKVWERLDEFVAPEVTPGFDARLYARIAAEEARKADGWRRWFWRPVAPLAAAGVVLALVLSFGHLPGRPDASKSEIEQVAQAVDDLDLLTPIGN